MAGLWYLNVIVFGLAHYLLALEHLAQPAAAASVEAYRAPYDLANVFFGLWLFPAGVLISHSNLLPWWLGGVALANLVLSLVMIAGEFTLTGWLVVRGSRTAP